MPAAKPRPGTLTGNQSIELEDLLGSSWEGFRLAGRTGDQGVLHHAYWRRPFDAGELRALFYRCQQVTALEYRIRQSEKELERLSEALHAAEQKTEFYRRQLRLESKMGFMLDRIAAPETP